jgi:N-acylneuraminate cytidylyltransferase
MKTIAIIPARGGSKGIPRKNLCLVGGKPLIVHSIQHAWQAPDVNRVVVSTDDAEIARVSVAAGAEVILRPQTISDDHASSESALSHVLDTLKEREDWVPDLVVFLQATSPMRPVGAVQAAIDQLQAEGADSLFSSVLQQGFVWRRTGRNLRSITYDHRERQRRQDAGEDLVENGSIYVFRPWVLREYGNRLGGKITTLVMDGLYTFQIDDPPDVPLMNMLWAVDQREQVADCSRIKLLALDFDGVLTDNRVIVSETGEESVMCSRSDGLGIQRLKDIGVEVIVISKEANPVVASRCRKLNIPCIQACNDKLSALRQYTKTAAIDVATVAFVGNDLQDLECLQWVGVPIVVSDCEPAVRSAGRLVTKRPGGHGAVREIAEWIIAAQAASKDSATAQPLAIQHA